MLLKLTLTRDLEIGIDLGVWLFGLEDLTLTRDLELKQSLGEWVRV